MKIGTFTNADTLPPSSAPSRLWATIAVSPGDRFGTAAFNRTRGRIMGMMFDVCPGDLGAAQAFAAVRRVVEQGHVEFLKNGVTLAEGPLCMYPTHGPGPPIPWPREPHVGGEGRVVDTSLRLLRDAPVTESDCLRFNLLVQCLRAAAQEPLPAPVFVTCVLAMETP